MTSLPQPADRTVLVIGDGRPASAVATALAGAGIRASAAGAIAEGATFDVFLDADAAVDATGDRAVRYLANDAAAVRGVALVWLAATVDGLGEVGVTWDEAGVDYRDAVPEGSGGAEGDLAALDPATLAAMAGRVAAAVSALLAGTGDPWVGSIVHFDAGGAAVDTVTVRRDPAAPRPGSLQERTAERAPAFDGQISAPDLFAELDGPNPPRLVDVREPWEAQLVAIPGSELMPLGDLAAHVGGLDPAEPIVLYCHHGMRSGKALQLLEQLGFTDLRHLTGGIDAWATRVDPEMRRY